MLARLARGGIAEPAALIEAHGPRGRCLAKTAGRTLVRRAVRRWITPGAVAALSALAVVATWPSPAATQAKVPNRPVQFIVPWAAGGGTDRIARMLAVLLEKELGQPVTVVNRTGGGGALGHTIGATAAPDGHTITMVTVDLVMAHWTDLTPMRQVPTYKDVTPIALLNMDAAGVQVVANSEWRTLQDLL